MPPVVDLPDLIMAAFILLPSHDVLVHVFYTYNSLITATVF